MAEIVLNGLSKTYPGEGGKLVSAVCRLNVTVPKGEFLVLVGPSGCGKTTTLRLIAGLELPSDGTISFDGRIMNNVPAEKRDVAMIFQTPALYPHMTGRENMAFGLRLRKLAGAEIAQRVQEAATFLGLADCLDRLPGSLSGGERQRVALGRALVRRPALLLLDEPLSNLDAPLRAQMRHQLSLVHRELGTTMIYVTHDQAEALSLGDRLAIMNKGAIQQVGEPATVYHSPANLFTAGFIGYPPMNLIRGRIIQNGNGPCFVAALSPVTESASPFAIRIPDRERSRFKRLEERDVILGFRPEDVVCPAGPGSLTNAAAVQAIVHRVEFHGSSNLLHLLSRSQSLCATVSNRQQFAKDQVVDFLVDLTQAKIFDSGTGEALS